MLKKLLLIVGLLVLALVLLLLAAAWLVDPDDYREQIAGRASEQLGREVELNGPMSLKVFPWLAIEINEVRVGNPPGFVDAPDLARIGTATVSVRVLPLLRGQLETGALTLSAAEFNLVTDRQGRSNLDGLLAADEAAADSGEPDLSGLSLGELRLDEVALNLIDLGSNERTRVQIDQFRLDPFRADQAVAFRLSGHIADGQAELVRLNQVDGELTVSRRADAIALRRLVAEFDVPDMGPGSLRAGADLDLASEPPQARLPVLDLILTLDGLRFGLQADEAVSLSLGETIEAQLPAARISLNEQTLTASGTVRLGETVQARLQVDGDRLDLPPLLESLASDAPGQPPGSQAEPDFEPLRALDLDLSLTLNQLRLNPQLTLSEVQARARLNQGVLRLSPMEARLLGGRFTGLVEVDLREDVPQVRVQPSLAGIQVGDLLALAAPVAPLSGEGDLTLDLHFSGLTLDSILRSLNGQGDYRLNDGALHGLDLRQLVDEEMGRTNLRSVSRSMGGQTAFDQLSGALDIQSGVVNLPDLNLAASDYGMAGRGAIDLPAGQLDYQLTVRLGQTLTAGLPRTLRDATGGEIPIRLAGPINQPVVTVDLASLAERALRQQIEQRLLPPPPRPRDDEQAQGETAEGEPRRERGRDRVIRSLLERSDSERRPPPDEREEAEEETEAEPPPA
ncbi:MAG: AsmA family protein [Wenzhouxiangella sp.]